MRLVVGGCPMVPGWPCGNVPGQQQGSGAEAGMQQAGRHTGRQRRDTEEEGLQQDEGAEQGEASQHTGLQQTGLQ